MYFIEAFSILWLIIIYWISFLRYKTFCFTALKIHIAASSRHEKNYWAKKKNFSLHTFDSSFKLVQRFAISISFRNKLQLNCSLATRLNHCCSAANSQTTTRGITLKHFTIGYTALKGRRRFSFDKLTSKWPERKDNTKIMRSFFPYGIGSFCFFQSLRNTELVGKFFESGEISINCFIKLR